MKPSSHLRLLLPGILLAIALDAPARADHCQPQEGHLCLQDDRFELTVTWADGERSGVGRAVPLSNDSGWFWFFTQTNVELMVKVLDGRSLNGHFWVFAGALTHLPVQIDIADYETGRVRSYRSEGGEAISLRDVEAFRDDTASTPSEPVGTRVKVVKAHGEEIDPADIVEGAVGHAHCSQGRAAGFPCWNAELQALVPLREMTPNTGAIAGNDLWGWTDSGTGREYALMGLSDGIGFVDVTEPTAPRVLGHLPTATRSTIWRDVKTYRDRAYVVADNAEDHGMQIFDLRRLRGRQPGTASLEPDAIYRQFGSAHNIAIDEDSGYAYAVGTDTCGGGLHMINLSQPESPTFAGCFSEDGYTHDVQCVRYQGPDARYRGGQVCFAANEDSLTIVDVTDKGAPRLLARREYVGRGYTHQAWLTEDSRFLLVDDETDERQDDHSTFTYVWDVQDLEDPQLRGIHAGSTDAVDHNQYTHRGYLFQANYRAGLRILDLARVAQGKLTEVAYFDIVPEDDARQFNGAWSVYPYLPSGNVLVSGTGQGLVIVSPQLEGFAKPEAPSALRAKVMGTNVELTWTNNCHHEEGLRVYRVNPDGSEERLAELATGTSSYLDRGLDPATTYRYRVASFSGPLESSSEEVEVDTDLQPTTCAAAGTGLCLLDERFAVTVEFVGRDGARAAQPVSLTSESGWFWFFTPSNAELVVKVLDGRSINGHFWVFTGSLSNVEYTIDITDTASGRVRSYTNSKGTFGGIVDTRAFTRLE